ncbi:MAG: extracellular solute-binding protein [Planctomycetota bacterium]|nr:extracellular solute-binding protein [Planctomycetota bacterium]
MASNYNSGRMAVVDDSSIYGRFVRVGRLGLGFLAALLVVAAFLRVGWRETERVFADPSDEVVELVLMHWSGGGGQQEDEIVEASIRAFESRHPTIRVKRINPGDSGQYFTKLQTMMAAGEPPDLFYMDFGRMAPFAEAGQLQPLDELFEGEVAAGADDALTLDAFFEPAVDAFRLADGRMGEGPLYGVPKDFTTVGIYWNRDLFDRAGATHPTDDWTWDDFVDAARRIDALEGVTGAELVTWPFVLRGYLWTRGASIVGPDGAFDTLAIGDEPTRAALRDLRDWRFGDDGFLARAEAEGIDPGSLFLSGRIGMVGPFGRWVVPSYRSIEDFEWDFAPLPRGEARANVIATIAWSMSSRSDHPEEAWQLLKWLTGRESQEAQARLGLAIPTLRAVAESDAFVDPAVAPANDRAYLDAVDVARVPPWPIDPAFQDQFQRTLDVALRTGGDVDAQVDSFDAWWTGRQASPLAPTRSFPRMPWGSIGLVVLALVATVAVAKWIWLVRTRPESMLARREERAGWLMVLPWALGFALFMLGPIVLSLLLSLSRWKGIDTLGTAEYVGLGNYREIIANDPSFLRSLQVTTYYAILSVPLGQVFALLAAVVLNAKLRGVEAFRAAWYLPSVLAGVGMAVLWTWVFRSDGGLMNSILSPLLSPFGLEPPEWFQADAAWAGPPAFAIMNLWLVGGSMLIYLAGLRNIPAEILEAADIDGARPLSRFVRVTLPMLSPVILFNGIMAIIGSFQVFTQAFVMTGGGPGDDTRFYVLYLYNQAFDWYEMGYGSALAWLLLVVVLVLTVVVLRIGGGRVHYEGMRA